MTTHNDSDGKVEGYRERWSKVHEITKEWVARMTTLVECWNKLDGNVGELSSWVNKQVTTIKLTMNISVLIIYYLHHIQDSTAVEGKADLSIEKLESQLNTLKTMFAEKQKLVEWENSRKIELEQHRSVSDG